MIETNYMTAKKKTLKCETMEQLEKQEKRNKNYYDIGILTVSEYSKLCGVEMDVAIKLSPTPHLNK